MSLIVAISFLTAAGALGVAALRRLPAALDPLEQLAYGGPLGMVVASLALLPLAALAGLSAALVGGLGLACALGARALWRGGGRAAPEAYTGSWALAALVCAGFAARWALLWWGALSTDGAGLWAGHPYILGDWTLHLGDTSAFAYGDNFPPEQPRLAGEPHAYHYLASATAAAMVALGMAAPAALTLHSFLCSCLAMLGLLAFARRLSRDQGAAALALALFLLGGGLSWAPALAAAAASPEPLRALLASPWDEGREFAANYRWLNIYFAFIMPQRAYLYGLPLGLLALSLLHAAVGGGDRRLWALAGVAAGLLPLAHLGTLLALALITPWLALLFPSRRWAIFFAAWAALAGPQLLFQQGGGLGAAAALRLQPGWVAAPDPWPWFWLKNLGLLAPLLLIALATPRLLPGAAGRFLIGFMPVFVLANLLVFQPWDWDNTKVLVYWFLAACVLVAALLARWWRWLGRAGQSRWARAGAAGLRGLLAAAVALMLLPGGLINLSQLLGRDRELMLSAEELRVAAAVRELTPARSLFAAGLQNNHPVPVLAGRRVLLGYPGWLRNQGFDPAARERDLRAIFALGDDAAGLIAAYGVDYVVVGPWERRELGADPAAFRARYPTLLRSQSYEIFAVGEPGAAAGP